MFAHHTLPDTLHHALLPTESWNNRRVLFVGSGEDWPGSALLRAHTFADQLRDDLFVLQVGAAPRHLFNFRRSGALLESLDQIERLEHSREAACQRCASLLLHSLPDAQVAAAEGDFVDAVVRQAAELGAEMIVLAPLRHACGHTAMQIVQAARVPVLVARPGRSHNIVVAATSLEDRRLPVLRHARSISALLRAEMLLVHNVEPSLLALAPELAMFWLQQPGPEASGRQQARLEAVAQALPRCVGVEVRSEPNTAEAILDASDKHDADLIVVGVARTYALWERVLGMSVAARVTDDAYRSVLLFPITPASSESTALAIA